jgi:hypothetical protein
MLAKSSKYGLNSKPIHLKLILTLGYAVLTRNLP